MRKINDDKENLIKEIVFNYILLYLLFVSKLSLKVPLQKPAGVVSPTKQRQEQQPTKVKYKTAITSGSFSMHCAHCIDLIHCLQQSGKLVSKI